MTAVDTFLASETNLNGPYCDAAAVVPNDAADLATLSRALYVGTTGDITVTMAGGEANVLIKAAPVGILPLRVSRVWATGTTATNLVALW